jgi:murein DD-endopeptidase MepM/ murein hydrolase activator NlpD
MRIFDLRLIAVLFLGLFLGACDQPTDGDGGSGGEPAPEPDPIGPEFTYKGSGDLVGGSGAGLVTSEVYAPDMLFPLSDLAFLNSQVWGAGGMNGPAGGQCDTSNYEYPWRDNYCETRTHSMSFCPASKGHQGVDIRPATCEKSIHEIIAAESGQITNVGSYSVSLFSDSGRLYRYLHLDMSPGRLLVVQDQMVEQGEVIGFVSNEFGGTSTTIHLHFDIKQTVEADDGSVSWQFVPPYPSLVAAYEALIHQTGTEVD